MRERVQADDLARYPRVPALAGGNPSRSGRAKAFDRSNGLVVTERIWGRMRGIHRSSAVLPADVAHIPRMAL